MRLRLATGPVCWGVDFADAPGIPGWREVVAGVAAAGYRWMELGPLGYLPPEAEAELTRRGIGVTAGFVFEPLDDSAQMNGLAAGAARVAARVSELGGRFLLIIDAVGSSRERTAGSERAPRLTPQRRDTLERNVARVAAVARRHGLRPLLHPHAGTHVEFEDEWLPLLDHAELCLDTGHLLYARADPVETYRRWADRVPYLHLKDVDVERCRPDFWASVRDGAFRPLGEGCLDLPALIAALEDHGFDGWAVVEQDRVPGGDAVADLIRSRRALEAVA